jgi:hypothetical protein
VFRAPVFARAPPPRKLVISHPAGPGLRGTADPKVSGSAQTRSRIPDIYRRHGTHAGTLRLAHQHPTSGKCTRDDTHPHDGQPNHHLHTASLAVRLDVTASVQPGAVSTAAPIAVSTTPRMTWTKGSTAID